MTTKRYTLIGQPTRGGHRFFVRDDHPGVTYIADNSGWTPEHTDDGPLFFTADTEITMGRCVPVTDRDDFDRGVVTVSEADAIWLAEQGRAVLPGYSTERAKIVKYLRGLVQETKEQGHHDAALLIEIAADSIEEGKHA